MSKKLNVRDLIEANALVDADQYAAAKEAIADVRSRRPRKSGYSIAHPFSRPKGRRKLILDPKTIRLSR